MVCVVLMELAPGEHSGQVSLSQPLIVPGGRLKLAKLKMLNTPRLGSMVTRSWNVCTQLRRKSKALSQGKVSSSDGAVASDGATAPIACSWASVNRPLLISICPAGVAWLATVLL